jgi:hypothetical protein
MSNSSLVIVRLDDFAQNVGPNLRLAIQVLKGRRNDNSLYWNVQADICELRNLLSNRDIVAVAMRNINHAAIVQAHPVTIRVHIENLKNLCHLHPPAGAGFGLEGTVADAGAEGTVTFAASAAALSASSAALNAVASVESCAWAGASGAVAAAIELWMEATLVTSPV